MLSIKVSIMLPQGKCSYILNKMHSEQRHNSINSWYGIRYAAAPVGNLRWAAPVSILSSNNYSSSEVINATTLGPACYNQYPTWNGPFNTSVDAGQSEDCLLLDVKVPANPVSNKLPVVIQIHGGGM